MNNAGGRDQIAGGRPTSSMQGRLGPGATGGSSFRTGGERRDDRGRGGLAGPGGTSSMGAGRGDVRPGGGASSPRVVSGPAPAAEPVKPSEKLVNKINGFVNEYVSEKDKKEALQVCCASGGGGGDDGLSIFPPLVCWFSDPAQGGQSPCRNVLAIFLRFTLAILTGELSSSRPTDRAPLRLASPLWCPHPWVSSGPNPIE